MDHVALNKERENKMRVSINIPVSTTVEHHSYMNELKNFQHSDLISITVYCLRQLMEPVSETLLTPEGWLIQDFINTADDPGK